jgi:prephenate dehydratase
MPTKIILIPQGTKVALQGELGSFSHRACINIFGLKAEPLSCGSFEGVFEAVTRKRVDLAVIPIENTLAGSIHKNFDLLARHSLEVIAETSLRVEHNLIACPGVSIRQIRQIYSHPAALDQCSKLLHRFKDVEKISFYDTAGSVKYIRDHQMKNAAAIASEFVQYENSPIRDRR